ncbi:MULTISPECIES: hypothetical protein [unclassified Streptomyces]|uniref:hypothetical protein n=1 Tax=unclassified Streptomyces TaxID=2593676 RepID=UPI000AA372B1|nr:MULTISPECIES: hypothetical protein [unclassified Streptomyces]
MSAAVIALPTSGSVTDSATGRWCRSAREDGAVVVTRPTGERRTHPVRDGSWICR